MADVRSLLRSELASRQAPAQSGSGSRVTKKRKVESGDGVVRKKLKPTETQEELPASEERVQPPGAQEASREEEEEEEEDVDDSEKDVAGPDLPSELEHEQTAVSPRGAEATKPIAQTAEAVAETTQPIDEDEWAAFEREVAAPTRAPQAPAAVTAAATISAAPVSAEELATQQQNDKENMIRAREAEAEGEREDAARFLEEEFDEMEELEQRVRRLKQLREDLRTKGAEIGSTDSAVQPSRKDAKPDSDKRTPDEEDDDNDDDDDDDDDDGDWDDWRFK
ncbi:hypothetical protein ASPZODRAFT_143966 [Penicilliopsis zonata CBS 506.65]|uniref:Uncharacterized protein n=1 Tax=Penicilliopsis zonata CBS 506.65 TaxID=1073090 RepID=A0A1L9SDS5_9EURO|nr:hypothetical protein ASPZODRAFT_143966 [Penicilliopsis zonata CBS 506.65]OJJ45329.1 hypothetical protein ASPZODRAFT_143966 [Penicilliopsis zonata CBS 506.65]